MEAGTAEIPRPAATRLSADVMRGASWPRRGLKPALILLSQKVARAEVENQLFEGIQV